MAHKYPDYLGVLITPQNGNRMCTLPLAWACDNAAYSKPDDDKFWNMGIDAWMLMEHHPPMWIAAPDVVGDHAKTLQLFYDWVKHWEFEIGYVPFPLAFVLQDGCTEEEVPWDLITAVFVGGGDDFKLRGCAELIQAAKRRGKLVHIGRVNSLRRLKYAIDVGADSVDGTCFSMFPDKKIEWAVKYVRSLRRSKILF